VLKSAGHGWILPESLPERKHADVLPFYPVGRASSFFSLAILPDGGNIWPDLESSFNRQIEREKL
jgi:hypothetical protein